MNILRGSFVDCASSIFTAQSCTGFSLQRFFQNETETKMHRAELIANKLCTDKVRERNYDLHQRKLKSIKSSVDTKAPPVFRHMQRNKKKEQLETGTMHHC